MDWIITIVYSSYRDDQTTMQRRKEFLNDLRKLFASLGFHQLAMTEIFGFSNTPMIEVFLTKRLDAKNMKEMAKLEELGEKVIKLTGGFFVREDEDLTVKVYTTTMKSCAQRDF